jgi:DNA-binding MarR family transcriptional regulator
MHVHDHEDPIDLDALTPSQQIIRVFHGVMRSYKQLMASRVSQHGTHPGQAICLRLVAHKDGISQSELANALGVKPPTVTVMLQKMEKAGIVERRTDEHDQRVTRIYLSEEGKRMHEEMHGLLDSIADEALASMSDDDKRELVRLLRVMQTNMEAASKGETA